MRSLRLLLTFVASMSLVACGGGSSPTEPTSPAGGPGAPTAPSTIGATITGQVSSSATAGAAGSGLASSRATPVSTISVVGTSISTTADTSGRFTLTGVPAGAAQLHFTGPGTDATLPIGEVRTGDTLTLVVAVNGTAAAVLSDSRAPGGAPTPINGVVRNLTGSVDQFEFTIDGQRIRGDRVTEFYGHPNMSPARVFEEMNNTRTEVKAWPRDGFWYAERLHVNLDDEVPTTPTPPTTPPTTPTPPQDTSASIEGPLTAMGGTRPALVLTIAGTTVRTDGSTVVQRRGDVQDLSVLQIGMTIHVVGDRRSDGSIDARRLQIKDDATGAEFEIEGSVGGLRGTCPTVTFGVNGFNIATTESTTFTPACGDLRSGNRVRVSGITQADGSVRATSVTRQ
jgi:Domain of unknown function (DUF5666)